MMPDRTSPCGPRRCRAGLTLFELVVVLSIMTILASIAAPRYASAIARYRLDTAARRVVADIEQTRALARATGATQTIRFSPSTHSYLIDRLTLGSSRSQVYTVKLAEPPYSVTLQSASFAGSQELRFGGFGFPADGGTVVVRSGTSSITINVDACTGAASFP
ncbi:MAG: prepilin-type N-terminal cleavage/methylation domain-containing protein [Planctomycetes bacterium]|nr:prepilin-type N-terminal cleavage/methylation domain-containing protein [Planctomycetota bacterium]